MWHRLYQQVRGVRGSVPADHWVHEDGRAIRREPEHIGDQPRWVLVTPLTDEQVETLLAEGQEG